MQAEEQLLYISTPSVTPVNFVIKQLGGTTISGVVSRDIPYVHDIGFGLFTQFHVRETEINSILSNRGYIIEAEDVVYVTARVIAGNGNQAGQITSKGLAALGTHFRIGGFINTLASAFSPNNLTFVSILATENNTTVAFDDIKTGAVLINNAAAGNTPANIILNAGESFVMAVTGPTAANRDALIGSLVTSDKLIAVNCGSYGGTNGEMSNLDLGFDQIVSAERTGAEYIFIKSTGLPNVERVLLIADQDSTEIFLNGSTTASYTLNAGEYVGLIGTDYSANGNLYVTASKDIFAFQSVGDNIRTDQANQEMFFVPPLSCQTPRVIDNIPFIEQIGNRNFTGRVTITTQTSSVLTFMINSVSYTLATLPAGIVTFGPTPVIGNANYECYTISGFTGNVSVFSTGQLYLTAYGSDGAATFGGYYSGFVFKPEVTFQQVDVSQSNCIPNVQLEVSTLSGFDVYQWFFNNVAISGATSATYSPTLPGYYKVKATLTACGINLFSDDIPVSVCAPDNDNDSVNDNVDLDNDNDGIVNCIESYGNQNINLLNFNSGLVSVATYNNTFTGTITTSTSVSTTPFVGATDGSFISEVAPGKDNFVKYSLNFAQPISFGLEYISTANPLDLLNDTARYIVGSPINKTITVLNPDNQLLIDTNYDGIYESGVVQFSSFEIRFKLNNTIPLPAGTGTFKFLTNLSTSISFTHINLLDSVANRVSLKFFASCVPKNSDNDNISDQLDLDSDNDGIQDYYEAQGATFIAISNSDTNLDGIDNSFNNGITPVDSDGDGVLDYLDLDSDNDGIYDLAESGSGASDTNNNGIVDGTNFGTNGYSNSLETSVDNGTSNYTLSNIDADLLNNYLDLETDNDGCNDVFEAGFLDPNNDGVLGNSPVIVNTNGLVTSGAGYITPNSNYIVFAPININTQPQNITTCELQNATFTIATNPVNSYQWQISTDGGTIWSNLVNNATYSGVTTIILTVTTVSPTMSGHKFRVILNKNGNSCGLISSDAILTTYALPVITSPITLVQCDDDTDGISTFNLSQKNNVISSNYLSETFTYYTNLAAANTENPSFLIANPIAFVTSNTTVYARVENINGCYRVSTMSLIVSVTQIPNSVQVSDFVKCDDFIDAINDDRDGIATFDFSSVTPFLLGALPVGSYTLNYYKNEADFLAETDASGNSLAIPTTQISNYRNIGYPNLQVIYARVESTSTNDCFGFRKFNLIVEELPIIYPVGIANIIRACDDDQDGTLIFNTSTLESTILNGQTNKTITYVDQSGNPITSPFPATFSVTTSQTITVTLKNNETDADDAPCKEIGTFQFIVDDLPEAFSLDLSLVNVCDDEINPLDQDGFIDFNTTTFTTLILNGQTGLEVKYTLEDGTIYNDSLPNPFRSSNQNVLVTVTNPINATCFDTYTIPFIIFPVPKIELTGEELVCTNLPTFTVTIDAGLLDTTPITDYNYQWFLNGTIIPGETSYTLTVNTGGTYSVNVTNANGCIRTKTIEVVASDIAHIQNIEIIDLVDINTIEIIVTGTGDYVYSLDYEEGFQTSNFFTNVPMGIHTVFIKDMNGCGTVSIEISVLGVPVYFTPNGDGYNDTWNIKGANERFYSNSIIYIFDRYGKLIKQISPIGSGWDGTFNGSFAPADDYWFNVKFDDGRSAKGHFSLKR